MHASALAKSQGTYKVTPWNLLRHSAASNIGTMLHLLSAVCAFLYKRFRPSDKGTTACWDTDKKPPKIKLFLKEINRLCYLKAQKITKMFSNAFKDLYTRSIIWNHQKIRLFFNIMQRNSLWLSACQEKSSTSHKNVFKYIWYWSGPASQSVR